MNLLPDGIFQPEVLIRHLPLLLPVEGLGRGAGLDRGLGRGAGLLLRLRRALEALGLGLGLEVVFPEHLYILLSCKMSESVNPA